MLTSVSQSFMIAFTCISGHSQAVWLNSFPGKAKSKCNNTVHFIKTYGINVQYLYVSFLVSFLLNWSLTLASVQEDYTTLGKEESFYRQGSHAVGEILYEMLLEL